MDGAVQLSTSVTPSNRDTLNASILLQDLIAHMHTYSTQYYYLVVCTDLIQKEMNIGVIVCLLPEQAYPNSKVHGAHMGPIWGRQDPGGPHVGPMNFAIWVDRWVSARKM